MSRFATSFRELDVYGLSLDLAVGIHLLTLTFPAIEKYALGDQMRRSSKSVCLNIAEAWRKRRYKPAFIAKLSDAETEAAETQCSLDIALRLTYLEPAQHEELNDRYEIVLAQIVSMVSKADLWCRIKSQSA